MTRANNLVLVLFAACLMSTAVTEAAVVNLPPGQSLQSAIDAANDGDVIILGKGSYKGDINYQGKAILIQGQGKDSIIKGTGYRPVVSFVSGEQKNSILDQVRVTGGLRGGAIITDRSSPTIRRCWIVKNRALGSGSAVFIFGNDTNGNSASLMNNIIAFNKTRAAHFQAVLDNESNAVFIENSSPLLLNNTLIRNDFSAIFISGDSSPSIMNNIIAFNKRDIYRIIPGEVEIQATAPELIRLFRRTRGMGISFNSLAATSNPNLEHNLFFQNAKGDVMIDGQSFDSFSEFASSPISSEIRVGSNISDVNPGFISLRKLNLALRKNSAAKSSGTAIADFENGNVLTDVDIGATGGLFPIPDLAQ